MKTSKTGSCPWCLSADDFEEDWLPVEKWVFLLKYARLAPSNRNSQPWLFHPHNAQIDLYADRTRSCPVADPAGRELIMSCGCAIYHLRLAMSHFGCLGKIEILPNAADPDLMARFTLGETAEAPMEAPLFHAITRRHTNRQAFRSELPSNFLLKTLQADAEADYATLSFIIDPDRKRHVADQIDKGDRMQWSDKAFREEMAKWVHRGNSGRHDGIPQRSFSVGDIMSLAGPMLVRTLDMGDSRAATDRDLTNGSPVLGLLTTRADKVEDWLQAGQSLARVLLRARAHELWASFLNQPLEVPALRKCVPRDTGCPGFPQAILRLGFGHEISPTPRRPIAEVLI